MEIKQIISERKSKFKKYPVRPGYKAVEAIVIENGKAVTRHIEIPKE